MLQLGHEAVHVRTLGMQRAPDVDIIARARAESRVVLTFDLDFGDVRARRAGQAERHHLQVE
ncbi:MAG: DUF5615 family PIN-like protein [Thermoanaerobaculia bacterium]